MRHVTPGTPAKIRAADWNTLADLAARSPDLRGDGGAFGRSWAFEFCNVKNNAGDLDRGNVLAIQEPLFDFADGAADIGPPLFLGVTPQVPDYLGRFVVLLEGVKAGKIARAVSAGLVKVKVDITNAAHRYAEILDNDASKLVSREIGSAQIVAAKSGTGTKWAWVRLGVPFQRVHLGQLNDALPFGEEGSSYLYDAFGGFRTVDVECRLLTAGQQLPDEAAVELVAQPHKDAWLVIACGSCPEDIPE